MADELCPVCRDRPCHQTCPVGAARDRLTADVLADLFGALREQTALADQVRPDPKDQP